jgi:hypothetical protein
LQLTNKLTKTLDPWLLLHPLLLPQQQQQKQRRNLGESK